MPLYFAAPLEWYAKVIHLDEVQLINDVKFPKQTNRHKFNYQTVEGPMGFSIPLVKDSRVKDYRSVEISYQSHWQNQLINALKTSYGKSPFFEYYDYRFFAVLLEQHKFLWDLNFSLLETTLKCLRSHVKLSVYNADTYIPDLQLEPFVTPYYQVFADKTGFVSGMSILDLIFNEGSHAWNILSRNQIDF